MAAGHHCWMSRCSRGSRSVESSIPPSNVGTPSLSYDVVVMFDEPTTQEGDSDEVGITLYDDTYTTDFYSTTV